jgi:hypothetical protein
VIGHGDVINLSILLAQLGLRRKFLGKRPRRNSPSYQTFAIPNVPFTSTPAGRNAQIAVTLPYDEREVSASRELSETTVQSSLGMFDCLMARVPKRVWAHTPFAVHPFAKIPL